MLSPRKVWAIPGSHGYWKVVDSRGTALMTGLNCESTARRWAQQEHRNLELQETPWEGQKP